LKGNTRSGSFGDYKCTVFALFRLDAHVQAGVRLPGRGFTLD
jgi:hypothetical protein